MDQPGKKRKKKRKTLVEISAANESADFQLPGESDVLNKF